MAIMFNPSDNFNRYDRNYVKEVYAQKQSQSTDEITTKQHKVDPGEGTILISKPVANHDNYYVDLAIDYLKCAITEDEFYGHLEDIYYSHGGWATEEIPLERRQEIFNHIMNMAYNGILDYYMIKNKEE